jgi:hypothetical protein
MNKQDKNFPGKVVGRKRNAETGPRVFSKDEKRRKLSNDEEGLTNELSLGSVFTHHYNFRIWK